MSNEREQKLKAMAEAERNSAQQQATCGNIGYAAQLQAVQLPLAERIRSQRIRAQVESRRAEQLMELELLLASHPEIARILDLLDAVKV